MYDYESPIDILIKNVQERLENEVIMAVQHIGIEINKEELVAALMYDRNQYEQGYNRGRADAIKHGHWTRPYNNNYKQCSVCKQIHYGIPWNAEYCPFCGAKMDEVRKDETI